MNRLRNTLSLVLAWLLVMQITLVPCAQDPQSGTPSQEPLPAPGTTVLNYPPSIDEAVNFSSVEIASLAEKFRFDPQAIRAKTEVVKRESKKREEGFKSAAKTAEKQIKEKERELEKLKSTTTDPEVKKNRRKIQCEILAIKKDITDKSLDFLQQQIADDVRLAKLDLLSNWSSTNRQLERQIQNETIGQREYGNVLDIGNRGSKKPFQGQEKDIKWGQKEIDAARQQNSFPKEVDDPVVAEYVNRVANNIARNSDLQVPLKVFVVQQVVRKSGIAVLDKDGQPQQVTNAMALPGGFLIVFAGVLLESENESEFAGVVAHEMAHVAARHSNRLANKGKVFNIASLAAIIGLQIFAPGLFYAASYLGYYLKGLLLQAIFSGMGIIFTLNALGVSREFESEADQLGMQYAWKTGYDPEGFIKLFDHLSQKEGYASHTSFFATHPAFGDRILNSLKEYKALRSISSDRQFLNDTSEFQEMKERLRDDLRKIPKKAQIAPDKPSLKGGEPEPGDCSEFLAPPPPVPALEKNEQGEDRSSLFKGHNDSPRFRRQGSSNQPARVSVTIEPSVFNGLRSAEEGCAYDQPGK